VVLDGVLMVHDEVVKALDRDIVSYSTSLGTDGSSSFSAGSFGQLFCIHLKTEVYHYLIALLGLNDVRRKRSMQKRFSGCMIYFGTAVNRHADGNRLGTPKQRKNGLKSVPPSCLMRSQTINGMA
jgi:hypothetical protein